MKQHILHLRRHLAAREPLFVGEEMIVPGTNDKAFVGNGIHPDRQAHLQENEYVKAVQIGEILAIPENIRRILISPSPLVRAVETANYLFVGMARAYAREQLGISGEKISAEQQKVLSEQGLHTKAQFLFLGGLTESQYKNSAGSYDEGNELVAEAYHQTVNPHFAGYKWLVQKGWEHDPRSEHPHAVAARGLHDLIPQLLNYDAILATSHQPNLEIITAALVDNFGQDANELFNNAGGAYGLGAGFELRISEQDGLIQEAQLRRTTKDPKVLDTELAVSVDVLRRYRGGQK